jgi:hypothetical protein
VCGAFSWDLLGGPVGGGDGQECHAGDDGHVDSHAELRQSCSVNPIMNHVESHTVIIQSCRINPNMHHVKSHAGIRQSCRVNPIMYHIIVIQGSDCHAELTLLCTI